MSKRLKTSIAVSPIEKALLVKAAALTGTTWLGFMRQGGIKEARATIAQYAGAPSVKAPIPFGELLAGADRAVES